MSTPTPSTPTNWIVFNNRRIVTPGDDESIPSESSSDQGINNNSNNNNSNNNNNPFSTLEDSDSDDDYIDYNESTPIALESLTTLIQDPGNHLLGASERIVVDLQEYYLNTPHIDTPDHFIAFTEAFNREFNRINSINNSDSDNNSNFGHILSFGIVHK